MASLASPVVILAISTALPITSAGRFWPLGPLGTAVSPDDDPDGNGHADSNRD